MYTFLAQGVALGFFTPCLPRRGKRSCLQHKNSALQGWEHVKALLMTKEVSREVSKTYTLDSIQPIVG